MEILVELYKMKRERKKRKRNEIIEEEP